MVKCRVSAVAIATACAPPAHPGPSLPLGMTGGLCSARESPENAWREVLEQRSRRQRQCLADQQQAPDPGVPYAELDVGDVVAGDAHRFGEGFLGEALFVAQPGDAAAKRLQGLVTGHCALDCIASLA